MLDWPHQTAGLSALRGEIELGRNRIVFTSPTGGGKSRCIERIIEWDLPTVIYTNRKMLIEQLSRGHDEAGIKHGIQASGYAEESGYKVQVASIQTVYTRWKAGQMKLHPAKVVIVDEAHNEKGKRMQEVLDEHRKQGAIIILVTATPVGLGGLAESIVQAGTTSELRACGALIPAVTYAPDEPSLKAYKDNSTAIIQQFREEVAERMTKVICGRVLEWYQRLNPDGKPALLFAPSVAASVYFTERFQAEGYRAAHIDSEAIVWPDGSREASNRESRERLKEASECGNVEIVSNRFVMREGVNWPHLAHGIFACTFGSVASYIQAGGRLLRNHPSLDYVVIQDHGGNWHKHDSLNADRVWHLEDTEAKLSAQRLDSLREKREPEPIVCPNCKKARAKGITCPACGHTSAARQRTVIETDGTLKEVRGDIYKARKVSNAPEDHEIWSGCVWRCYHSGKTFSQARGLFLRQTGKVPGPDFPYLPKSDADWTRLVCQVLKKKNKTIAH